MLLRHANNRTRIAYPTGRGVRGSTEPFPPINDTLIRDCTAF